MGAEHRRDERKQLKRYLTVLNGSNGRPLGHLVDISRSGMMLICKEPLPPQQSLLVDIQIPRPSKNLSLKLHAVCVWTRSSTSNQQHHGCGMHFDTLSAEQLVMLDRLILSDSSL